MYLIRKWTFVAKKPNKTLHIGTSPRSGHVLRLTAWYVFTHKQAPRPASSEWKLTSRFLVSVLYLPSAMPRGTVVSFILSHRLCALKWRGTDIKRCTDRGRLHVTKKWHFTGMGGFCFFRCWLVTYCFASEHRRSEASFPVLPFFFVIIVFLIFPWAREK